MKTNIKTPAELKAAVEAARSDSYFFSRATMSAFGDTMRNYSVRQPQPVETRSGTVEAYELVRKRPVKNGLVESTWFHAEKFSRVFPINAD